MPAAYDTIAMREAPHTKIVDQHNPACAAKRISEATNRNNAVDAHCSKDKPIWRIKQADPQTAASAWQPRQT